MSEPIIITSHKPPEEIRRDLEQTRASLAHNLETLSSEMREAVQEAKSSVGETILEARKSVSLSHHVEQYPWSFVAGSVCLGYLVGHSMFSHDKVDVEAEHFGSPMVASKSKVAATYDYARDYAKQEATDSRVTPHVDKLWRNSIPVMSGLGGMLYNAFHDEIAEARKLAIGTAASVVRELAKEMVPKNLAPRAGEVIDRLTRALGGSPVPIAST